MRTYGVVTSCCGGRPGAEPERSRWNAIIGAVLILAGVALLADRAGVLDIGIVWDYWPLIPIGLGATGLLFAPPGERSGGFWLLTGGIYSAIGVWGLFGLSWATGWPIFLVAAGFQVLIEMAFEQRGRAPGRAGDPAGNEAHQAGSEVDHVD